MSAVRAIVVANLLRQTRDRVGLFFMVVMPFVTIMFVGLAMGGAADARIPVAVVAADGDPTAAAVLRELSSSPALEVRRADSAEEVRADVRRGAVAAGLVIPQGSTRFDLVMTQTSGSGMAARSEIDVAVGKVSAVMEATRAAEKAGAGPELAAEHVRAAQAESAAVAVRDTGGDSGGPTGFAYTAPANLLLFTFINSMAVAAALVESRRIGMVRRTLAAPVREGTVLFGEALSRLVVAAAQALLIIVVSALMFGVSWGDPLGVTVVVALFCLVATGAAMLVGALVANPQQAPAIGPPLGIVLGMLGGCLWPKEVAGEALTTIGYLFPHSWAMDALLALTRPGSGLGTVWTEVAVLAGMAALALGIALIVFRRRALRVA
ncbi:ABC transporter permease [Actinokineospora fastidiosa]|uniref:Permease n=1 Tax=Actinokineospora fastidiosa TaxID=1816 RepID=A0A918G2R6_9PSEU|nr:ABC transporter permease [Actinokineospora fastidiosa]GGS16506.1 permease [Actinokineospora fastidiosa]